MLLRVIVDDEAFEFNENLIGTHEDGARPWDRLAHVWRSWFALDHLNGITAILESKRHESKIRLGTKERFQIAESQSRLETYMNVAVSLADDIGAGLTGLLCYETLRDNQLDLSEIDGRLKAEKIDLDLLVASKRLSHVAREVDVEEKSAELFQESAQNALRLALESGRNQELAYTATSIRTGIKRLSRMKYIWTGLSSVNVDEVFRKSVDPSIASEVALRDATVGIILYTAWEGTPRLRVDARVLALGHCHWPGIAGSPGSPGSPETAGTPRGNHTELTGIDQGKRRHMALWVY